MSIPTLTIVPKVVSTVEHPGQVVLYYFHDPMCSWCWAFRPAWGKLINGLPEGVVVQGVLGGLAPDTDEPMPVALRAKIQDIWKKIQYKVPGTEFNFNFWRDCTPRRSTFIACRAVIAAKCQHPMYEEWIILAIQAAYYLDARNPSEISTLVEIATSIGLEPVRFAKDLNSSQTNAELQYQMEFGHSIGIHQFPSLVLKHHDQYTRIKINYRDPSVTVRTISKCLKSSLGRKKKV